MTFLTANSQSYQHGVAIRSFYLFLVCILLLYSRLTNLSFAQQVWRIEMPSSPNPVGSGARALGMGGAFIAIADDATAASWNPGGLVQLEEPEFSIVSAYTHRMHENEFGTNPEASGTQLVSYSRVNYLSAAYPFALFGRRMLISPNYQHLFDFTRKASFPLEQHTDTLSLFQNYESRMNGSLSAIGIAYCVQITPVFSFGVTLNLWEDGLYKNEWKEKSYQRGSGLLSSDDASYSFSFEIKSLSRYSFSGRNANFGILWDINKRLTMGIVLKTPFKADLIHTFRCNESLIFPDNPESNIEDSSDDTSKKKLDMPMSYGIGIAYRFSDNFTAALDIYRTEWSDFILTDSDGNKTSPISLKPPSESDINDTTQIRFGIEHLFIGPKYLIPVRYGIFYDPAPAVKQPDDYFGISLGSGISIHPFIFDITYHYRFGNEVGRSMLQALDFSQDLHEHTIYSSLIIHFR
ncbi:MAG: OmpP1/FadL family transporter [bacterium]